MSMRLLVNSMPMLKRNPLRLRKLHFKSFHFNIVFKKGLFVLAMEKSLLSCLRALELPGQNSIFPCKGTVDRKNVKCRCRFQSEGLPGSLPQIFPLLQNLGIPSALSDLTLALSSLLSAVAILHEKRFSRPRSSKGFNKREKKSN